MCKCKTMSEKLLGDGCDECNPEMARQIECDNFSDCVELISSMNIGDLQAISAFAVQMYETARHREK